MAIIIVWTDIERAHESDASNKEDQPFDTYDSIHVHEVIRHKNWPKTGDTTINIRYYDVTGMSSDYYPWVNL